MSILFRRFIIIYFCFEDCSVMKDVQRAAWIRHLLRACSNEIGIIS